MGYDQDRIIRMASVVDVPSQASRVGTSIVLEERIKEEDRPFSSHVMVTSKIQDYL